MPAAMHTLLQTVFEQGVQLRGADSGLDSCQKGNAEGKTAVMPTATHTLLQMIFNLQGQRLSAAAAGALQGSRSGMHSCKHDCFRGTEVWS